MRKPTTGQREMRAQPMQDTTVDGTDSGDLLFTGYAIVYDQPSEFMGFTEYVAAGAAERILATGPDVRMLGMNHDVGLVLARTKSGTLDLSSDEKGVKAEARLARTVATEQLASSVQRGDVDAMSYGFASAKDTWDESDPDNVTRTILDYRALYDVSPVAFAAFSQTEASFRNLDEQLRAGTLSEFERRAILQLTVWTDDDAQDQTDADADADADAADAELDVCGMSHRATAQLRERRRALRARI